MGTDYRYFANGKYYTAEDLSSFVLRRLREDAESYIGEPVTEAVISVPAYFNDDKRCATKNAGRLAGLTVERNKFDFDGFDESFFRDDREDEGDMR